MNQSKPISRRSITCIWIAVIVLMIIGSFEDYQISSAIVNQQNPYGILFAGYGSVPIYLLGAVTGFLMLTHRNPNNRGIALLQSILGLLLLIAFGIYLGYDTTHYITTLPVAAAIVIGIMITTAACAFTGWALKEADYHDVVRLCWTFVLLGIAGVVIVNAIKIPWSRPRMRFLISAENHGVPFHPWFRPGCPESTGYIASGVSADQFRSFPSGHTQSASCALGIYYLAGISPKLRRQQNIFLWIGIAWAFLTALSRIIVGAHFLTDVTMGFAIEFALFHIAGKTVMRKTSIQ